MEIVHMFCVKCFRNYHYFFSPVSNEHRILHLYERECIREYKNSFEIILSERIDQNLKIILNPTDK